MKIAQRGTEAIVVSTIFTTLALAVVCIRLYTRFCIVRYAGLEDWVIIAGMLFSIAFTICAAIQAEYGLGHHLEDINPVETRKSLKAFWVSVNSYFLCLTFTKTSILLQYKRVFISRKFQKICWTMLIVHGLFGVWCVIGTVLACRPIRAFWTREPAHCFNQVIMWLTNAGVIILTDLIIIIMPIPVIRHLQLAKRQKHALIAIFAVGGIICLISIVRLHSLIQVANSTDPTYTNADAATWSAVELNIGIICACLPVLRPLLSRAFPKLTIGDHDIHQSPRSNGHSHNHSRLSRCGPSLMMSSMKSKRSPSISSDEEKLAGGIEVFTVVDVTVESRQGPSRPVYESEDDSKKKDSMTV